MRAKLLFLLDLCDLLDSFSVWWWPGQRGYNVSLVLGGRAGSEKTHGWPSPAHGELLTLLLTVVLNEKLRMMGSVKCSTLQFAFCSIPALFWNKDTTQYKPTTDNEAQFLHHLQLVEMILDSPSADGEAVPWYSLPQRLNVLIYSLVTFISIFFITNFMQIGMFQYQALQFFNSAAVCIVCAIAVCCYFSRAGIQTLYKHSKYKPHFQVWS